MLIKIFTWQNKSLIYAAKGFILGSYKLINNNSVHRQLNDPSYSNAFYSAPFFWSNKNKDKS